MAVMSEEMIAKLSELAATATPGPWHVRPLNDDVCMGAVGVATEPDRMFDECGFIDPDWPVDKMVAVCLLQDPRLAVLPDRRWNENAELIAAMRNALPELLRLAQLGLRHGADLRADATQTVDAS